MIKNPLANTGDADLIPGTEDPLEKEMATHSSILAWRIPWPEEPGGATVHGVSKESAMNERPNNNKYICVYIYIYIYN